MPPSLTERHKNAIIILPRATTTQKYARFTRPRTMTSQHFYANLSRTLRAAIGGGSASASGSDDLKICTVLSWNRAFTENSEHSRGIYPKTPYSFQNGSSLRLHLTLTNIICLSFIPDDGRSSFCSSVQSQSFISVDSGILLWATLFRYPVLGLL